MHNTNLKPLVTILCITYNQEAYIRDALDGFVMQKTNFPFIALVHDDASTDNTPNIIREYAEKYPDIIKPIFETENQYSKNDGALWRIVNNATIESGCKYVALCEGDDFWTSPDKLQIQVDFLENNSEYSMCFHDVDIKAEKGRDWYDVFGKLEDRDYDAFEDIYHWCVPTCSIMSRSTAFQALPQNDKFRMRDNVVVLTCGRCGKLRCIPEKYGVYRLTPTSWIGGQSNLIQRYKYISHYYGLIEEFKSCRNDIMYGLLKNQYFQLLSILKRDGENIEFERIKNEYLAYFGQFDLISFTKFYYTDNARILLKKILGKHISSFISKIKGYVNS